jgi:hypothetical protein
MTLVNAVHYPSSFIEKVRGRRFRMRPAAPLNILELNPRNHAGTNFPNILGVTKISLLTGKCQFTDRQRFSG